MFICGITHTNTLVLTHILKGVLAPTFSHENLQPWKQILHQTRRERCEKLTEQNIDRPCLSRPSHRVRWLSAFDLKWSLRHHNGIQESTNTSTVQKAFDKTAEERPGCLASESPSKLLESLCSSEKNPSKWFIPRYLMHSKMSVRNTSLLLWNFIPCMHQIICAWPTGRQANGSWPELSSIVNKNTKCWRIL